MSNLKPFSAIKIFGEITRSFEFKGKGATRFIEYEKYYLLINFQKSSYGPRFFINAGILYKDLLNFSITETDLANAFKSKSKIWPHVSFRIESCPPVSRDLQENFDQLLSENRTEELKKLLQDAVQKMLEFIYINHDRKTIRRFNEEKIFPAMILKEV